MSMNLQGHPELTRFLTFCALKEDYYDDEQLLMDAMAWMAGDLKVCMQQGITIRSGEVLRLAPVSIKGDWPFLIEAMQGERHFRRAPKTGNNTAGHGICHLCLADWPDFPFTDCGASPRWELSMGSAAAVCPWSVESPFTLALPSVWGRPETLYRPDPRHNHHLGHGRYFLASAMVLMSQCYDGTSVAEQFANMSAFWRVWCRDQKTKPILLRIGRDTVGWMVGMDWPEGRWQKAETTTQLSDSCAQSVWGVFSSFFCCHDLI